MNHEYFMQQAIDLAGQAPQYPFGAVIIRREDGQCVGRGFNRSDLSPIFHGEMVAINDCASRHRPEDWGGFDLYTTAEPCAMCQGAIEWAGIGRVFYGSSIPYLQKLGWWQIDLRATDISARAAFRDTVIVGGILEAECNALFAAANKGCFDGGSE
jgi:tRNA(adenine34) deaminase